MLHERINGWECDTCKELHISKYIPKKHSDEKNKKCTGKFILIQYVQEQLIKERYEYWEDSRGAYILSQHHRDELKEFIFTGESKGLCNFERYKKEMKK